jgi:hypothetical protein
MSTRSPKDSNIPITLNCWHSMNQRADSTLIACTTTCFTAKMAPPDNNGDNRHNNSHNRNLLACAPKRSRPDSQDKAITQSYTCRSELTGIHTTICFWVHTP